jgi:2-polyprenyl-6-hydroxyphenyl methylase/3-demethylubiquinone-9 3-methyltransferase
LAVPEPASRAQHDHGDLVGEEFWDQIWLSGRPHQFRSYNFYHRRQLAFLRQFLPSGARFLELGAGNSRWVPLFARERETWGIDYSRQGLAMVAKALGQSGRAHLVLGDVFDPDNGVPRDYFDVVYSEGLFEHFEDASLAAEAFASYARAGGWVVTSVPNMRGWIGALHKAIAPEIYRSHVRYTPVELDAAHVRGGLRPDRPAQYWGHLSLGVVNYGRVLRRLPRSVGRTAFAGVLGAQQLVAWSAALLRLPETGLLSPFLCGAYRRTDE